MDAMKDFSIYHIKRFGHSRVVRFNLSAVKRLLPECDIDSFDDLTEGQRSIMQRRVNSYVAARGRIDLSGGVDAVEAQVIPSYVIKARKERIVKGQVIRGSEKRIMPERIIAAKPEMPPSIDHLPHHSVLDEVIFNDQKQHPKKKP